MNDDEEKTEQIDLGQIQDSIASNQATLKMAPVGAQVTVDREIPDEILNRSKPSTIKMSAVPDIEASLLESIPVLSPILGSNENQDLDATREIIKIVSEEQEVKADLIEFVGSVDTSGRIQLPANVLIDPRIRPGQKIKVIIETN